MLNKVAEQMAKLSKINDSLRLVKAADRRRLAEATRLQALAGRLAKVRDELERIKQSKNIITRPLDGEHFLPIFREEAEYGGKMARESADPHGTRVKGPIWRGRDLFRRSKVLYSRHAPPSIPCTLGFKCSDNQTDTRDQRRA